MSIPVPAVPRVQAIMQARMSSRRFPGKVLAPFRGKPVIWHVVAAVRRALPRIPIVVATSTDAVDDPLNVYLRDLGIAVFRGSRDCVFDRFRACVAVHPCEWVLRICADSPLMDTKLLQTVVSPQNIDMFTRLLVW
ncbi:MAG: hypothetical protein C4576_06605 [Desulfobacteraceae bacterium]|nr:MAG: hypothetical protein C4576_06605 [Desulfobacteraceae bacterium]